MIFHALTAKKNNVRRTSTLDPYAHLPAAAEGVLTETHSADAWYHAAQNLPHIQDRLVLLQRALTVDPFHRAAAEAWELLTRQAENHPHAVPMTRSGRLAGVVALFTERGWELKVEMPRIAQLQKRYGVSWWFAALAIVPLNFVGLVIVIHAMIFGRLARLNVQIEGDDRLLVMGSRDSEYVSDPHQLLQIAAAVPSGVSLHGALALWVLSSTLWMLVLS